MTHFFMKEIDKIPALRLITPFYAEDSRGYFLKAYEKDVFSAFQLHGDIQEDFETYSKKGVVRGLHFQTSDPQTKIVRTIQGEIFDVAVDLRKNSATFGHWHGEILSSDNHIEYYIPAGFAHGFLVLSEYALVQYKCFGKYHSAYDTGILWNDPVLSIDWPLQLIGGEDNIIDSDKDAKLQSFTKYKSRFGGFD